MGNAFGVEYIFDPESGHFISERHQRVAEVLNDYNQELFLAWIPPGERTALDNKPFAVIHRRANGYEYIVSKFAEEEVNETLLARILVMDQEKASPLEYLRALELAEEAMRMRALVEEREEMHDRAKSMWHTRKHTYQLGKGRKVEL